VPGDRIPITRLTARLEGPAVHSPLTDAWGQARRETGYRVKLPLEKADPDDYAKPMYAEPTVPTR
jgi:hypothetical protein